MRAESWEDRRSSERVSDDSALVITGCLGDNAPFTVAGSIRDVSLGGISFFTSVAVERLQVLDLTLISTQIQSLTFRVKARVLRVSPASSGRYHCLVAAQFEDDFIQTGGENIIGQMAHELVKAVEYDENLRSGHNQTPGVEQPARCKLCGIQLDDAQTSTKSMNGHTCYDCHARMEQLAWNREIQSELNKVTH